MTCKKCGSDNINIQIVSNEVKKKRGWKYWLLFGWLIDLASWFLLFFWRLVYAIFRKKTKMVNSKQAICQNCGNTWVIK